jgi:predicted RNase H-like HicB family nuclease
MRFHVTLDRDEDGVWVAECPSIPGCVSQGTTKEEALENVREAIALCLEARSERGLPLTIETREEPRTAPILPLPLKLSQASSSTTWSREGIYGDDGR